MRELSDKDRRFIEKVDGNIYLSIYAYVKKMIDKEGYDISDTREHNDIAYEITKAYAKEHWYKEKYFNGSSEENKETFRRVLSICNFILYDYRLKNKNIKYKWIIRNNKEYVR